MARMQLSVSIFYVRIETVRFNDSLSGWASSGLCQRMVAAWFGVGAVVGGLLMVTALVVLSLNLYWTCVPSGGHEPVLAPLVRAPLLQRLARRLTEADPRHERALQPDSVPLRSPPRLCGCARVRPRTCRRGVRLRHWLTIA